MTYKLSRKAADDLEDIYVFSAAVFGLDQADRYFSGLIDALALLDDYPLAARARPELGLGTRGYRYSSHMIFYRPEGPDIFVQRIRHVREDWQTDDTPG